MSTCNFEIKKTGLYFFDCQVNYLKLRVDIITSGNLFSRIEECTFFHKILIFLKWYNEKIEIKVDKTVNITPATSYKRQKKICEKIFDSGFVKTCDEYNIMHEHDN